MTLTRIYAFVLGIFLLIEGFWGEFSDVVFGILATNRVHATIHILLGAIAIWTVIKGGSRAFLIFFGALVVVVGVAWFLPFTNSLVVTLFNVNQAVAVFNILVGGIALIIAFIPVRQDLTAG